MHEFTCAQCGQTFGTTLDPPPSLCHDCQWEKFDLIETGVNPQGYPLILKRDGNHWIVRNYFGDRSHQETSYGEPITLADYLDSPNPLDEWMADLPPPVDLRML